MQPMNSAAHRMPVRIVRTKVDGSRAAIPLLRRLHEMVTAAKASPERAALFQMILFEIVSFIKTYKDRKKIVSLYALAQDDAYCARGRVIKDSLKYDQRYVSRWKCQIL